MKERAISHEGTTQTERAIFIYGNEREERVMTSEGAKV